MEQGDPIALDLADDDRPPDDDDLDAVEVPDPEDVALDPPPQEETDDLGAADLEPQSPAQHDAPVGDRESAELESSGDDVARRWRVRLRIREELLRDALAALERAQTTPERDRARARVAKREEQVAYARRVLARRESTVIERVIRAAMLGHQNRAAIRYTQDRPHEVEAQGGRPRRWDGIRTGLRAKNGQFPAFADCSSFVTWCYWDALGGPDAGPDIINGQSWAAGYTGSQIEHGQQVPIDQARRGDLAFYERKNGKIGHVTVVVAPGRVVSHGDHDGPELLALNYDGKLRQVRRYVA